ncbi:MAG: beta-N-acetylhexosaminidase [Psychromonas sp.]|nr:beta-N-acetylhexosaminidase [Psychromonas sp.]
MSVRQLFLMLLCFSASAHANAISQHQLTLAYKTSFRSAKVIVNKMTDREKIGQLMLLDFRYWKKNDEKPSKKNEVTKITPEIKEVINYFDLGGIILFRENLYNTTQVIDLIQGMQDARSTMPLFIAIDQEGGYVTRLREGVEMPGNMALGASGDPHFAKQAGEVHGSELAALGFNFNFAPVVDVNSNQNNPVIGVRSYSDDLPIINEMSAAYIEGIHQYGLLTLAKHFPGHGNVSVDSHHALPIVPYSEAQWRAVDLKAFENVFAKGVDAVMTAHVVVPSVDNSKLISSLTGKLIGRPATLSKKMLTGILRDELHFKGLIVTDALDMGAIANNFDPSWTVETAILAGADVILMPVKMWDQNALKKLEKIYKYLEQQMKINPQLTKRINQSARLIVQTKLAQKLSAKPVDKHHALMIVNSKKHLAIEANIAEKAITLIENKGVLPFALLPSTNVLVISDEAPRNEIVKSELMNIAKHFKKIKFHVETSALKLSGNDINQAVFTQKIAKADYVILITYNLKNSAANAQAVINLSHQMKKPTVVIASRNPYDIAYLNNVKANIAIYGITGFDVTNDVRNKLEANIRAGIRTLFKDPMTGKPLNDPSAKLPVNIKDRHNRKIIYHRGYGLSYASTKKHSG